MPSITPNNHPSLLVVGDAVAATGFSRVNENILTSMTGRFHIRHIAINYFGDPHHLPWELYPASVGGDAFGYGRIAPLYDAHKPDLIFIVGNLPRLQAYLEALGERKNNVRIVAYCPVEAAPIPPERIAKIQGVDILVFYTEFAKNEFMLATKLAEERSFKSSIHDVRVVPHGVDTSMFFPREINNPDREAVKRKTKFELYRGDKEHSNSFVVLNANRNDHRKRIDLTIRGFADFSRDKDRFVKLHLHMGSKDFGWKVVDLCKRFGIYDRLIMTNYAVGLPSVDSGQLNDIYNAADVGINTSSSEGWGLVSFEHAATATAQLVPAHASCAELWSDSAEMMEPNLVLTDPQSMTDQHIIHPDVIARTLERLYSDREHRHMIADQCYQKATRPEFRWSEIALIWSSIFEEALQR